MNAHFSNSLEGWQVDPELIASCGTDLRHPECVLTAADDALWISDARGIIYISGDRKTQRLIKQKSAIGRSEEHTSELQSLMRISYAVFCLKKKKTNVRIHTTDTNNDIQKPSHP